jgi:putative drug exporter of the RND superfamily
MTRFAEAVLRHRRLICVLWVVLVLVGGATAGLTTDRLVIDYSLPGQPGYDTDRQIVDTYGQSARDPLVAVVTVPDGQTVEDARDEVGAVFGAVRSQVPGVRVADYASTGDQRFITDDGRSTFGLVYVPPPESLGPGLEQQVRPALEAAAAEHGMTSGLTGYALLSLGASSDAEGPSVLVETLLGGLSARSRFWRSCSRPSSLSCRWSSPRSRSSPHS